MLKYIFKIQMQVGAYLSILCFIHKYILFIFYVQYQKSDITMYQNEFVEKH
jgi:hypothetical protein